MAAPMRALWIGVLLASIATGCADDGDEAAFSCDADGIDALEHCIVYDDGWNFFCIESMVYVDDLTAHGYCLAGEDEPVCTVGGVGEATLVAACGGPCGTDDIVWVETVEEFDNFDLDRVCETPVGG